MPGPAGDDLRDRAGIDHRQDHRLEALQGLQLHAEALSAATASARPGSSGAGPRPVELGVDLADQFLLLREARFVGGRASRPSRFPRRSRQTVCRGRCRRRLLLQLRRARWPARQAGASRPRCAPGWRSACNGDLGAGGIEHAHRLVRQLAAGDEARTQLHRPTIASSRMRTLWCAAIAWPTPRSIDTAFGVVGLRPP